MVKCKSCIEKKAAIVQDVKYVLVDYDGLTLLCESCYSNACYFEGEINLDAYHIELGLYGLLNRVNEVLDFHSKRYKDLLDRERMGRMP